jgi:hypothetical protein
MRINSALKVLGKQKVTIFNKDGSIKEVEKGKNLIVNVGKEFASKLLNGVSVLPFKYIALGTGATEALVGDTELDVETSATGLARKEATCDYEVDYKATINATFTNGSGGSVTLKEAGIFDAGAVGNMLARRVFLSVKILGDGESVAIEWTITFA